MMRRLRVSHLVVQTHLVWDDGEELSPGPEVGPAVVALADLPHLADAIRADLAAKTVELNQSASEDHPTV